MAQQEYELSSIENSGREIVRVAQDRAAARSRNESRTHRWLNQTVTVIACCRHEVILRC
jgi:hypothetical protein